MDDDEKTWEEEEYQARLAEKKVWRPPGQVSDKYPKDKILLTNQDDPSMNGVWIRASVVAKLEEEIARLRKLLEEEG